MASGATGNTITRVNTHVAGTQSEAAITLLDDGGYVIAWQSDGQDGSKTGIYLQRFDANGDTVGAETHVSVSTTDEQEDVAIAALADGGWIVTWSGKGTADGSGYGAFQRRYDASGNPENASEDLVNLTTAGYQYATDVASLGDQGWITVWGGPGSGDSEGIFMSLTDAEGTETVSEALVNTTVAKQQANPSVSALDDGGWIVVWQSRSAIDDVFDVHQQRFASDGSKVGAEARVNTWTENFQQNATVAGLADGGWVVAWSSSEQDADGKDEDEPGAVDTNIYLQRYDADGETVKGEIRVNKYQAGTQAGADITALSDGGFLVSWWGQGPGGGGGVHFQRYGADGKTIGGQETVSGATGGVSPDAIALEDGGWIMTWHAYDFDTAGYEVMQRRYAPDIAGSAKSEPLAGTGWAERLLGLGGKDRLDGKAGDDFLDGGAANDTLTGGGGIDTFVFGTGDGRDRVTDFVAGGTDHEFVDLSALKSVKDWKDLGRNHLEKHGGDLWIDAGKGDVLILEDTTIKDVSEDHFLF